MLASNNGFTGFHGVSYALLLAGCVSLAFWLAAFGYRWLKTRPDLPRAGAERSELPTDPEPPAIVNLLVNNWNGTSSAISATLVDLAARRILGLELAGLSGTVVRLRDVPASGSLMPWEEQVYRLVASRATGGSAPIEAVTIDDDSAGRWTGQFRKSVVAEARRLGLARKRWEPIDYAIVGIGLAFVFGFFALAFGAAHVGQSSSGGESMSAGDWLGAAAFAWFLAMGLVTRSQAITDTPDGKRVCATWLGMRDYFRSSHAFDGQPPASVAVWDRLLAYGVATGAAHDAARGAEIVAEDQHSAWTRSSGTWREIRIEYPERFSFGQSPLKVVGEGIVRTLFWGGLAFFVLPVLTRIVWSILQDLPDDSETGIRGLRVLILLLSGVLVVAGGYLAGRAVGGVVRLVRGALDLGKTVTIEGEVVKVHGGRFAIDDGRAGSVVALFPPVLGPGVARGQVVRIVVSPHLHHVSSLTVLREAPAPEGTGPIQTSAEPLRAASLPLLFGGLTPDALLQATGYALRPLGRGPGPTGGVPIAAEQFADNLGNTLTITVLPSVAARVPLLSALTNSMTRGGEPVPGIGDSAVWTKERALIVTTATHVLVVDADFPGDVPDRRLAAARRVAALLIGDG